MSKNKAIVLALLGICLLLTFCALNNILNVIEGADGLVSVGDKTVSVTDEKTSVTEETFPFMYELVPDMDETATDVDETAAEEPVIKDVAVTERPLTEIVTDDSNRYLYFYDNFQPFIDDAGGMYYYDVFDGDGSCRYLLHYDIGVGEPTAVGSPDIDSFSVGVARDGAVYGVERDFEYNNTWFLTVYRDGRATRLCDDPVKGWFFAEEGIYYECDFDQIIYLMDYESHESRFVVEIPLDLYYKETLFNFVVYDNVLWCSYADKQWVDYPYPLWCYDFDGNFTRFDRGGIGAVNNGFLYYTVIDDDYKRHLYRFDCEDYCIEKLLESKDIGFLSVGENAVLYTKYNADKDVDYLYILDSKGSRKILSPDKLGRSDYLLWAIFIDGRLYVTGGSEIRYICLAEIDRKGNVLEIIHEE